MFSSFDVGPANVWTKILCMPVLQITWMVEYAWVWLLCRFTLTICVLHGPLLKGNNNNFCTLRLVYISYTIHLIQNWDKESSKRCCWHLTWKRQTYYSRYWYFWYVMSNAFPSKKASQRSWLKSSAKYKLCILWDTKHSSAKTTQSLVAPDPPSPGCSDWLIHHASLG